MPQLLSLLSRFWYTPIIVIALGLWCYRGIQIEDLKHDNKILTEKLFAADLKIKNNEELILASNRARDEAVERQKDTDKFLEVIKNAPQSENGPIATVLKRALTRLSDAR